MKTDIFETLSLYYEETNADITNPDTLL